MPVTIVLPMWYVMSSPSVGVSVGRKEDGIRLGTREGLGDGFFEGLLLDFFKVG